MDVKQMHDGVLSVNVHKPSGELLMRGGEEGLGRLELEIGSPGKRGPRIFSLWVDVDKVTVENLVPISWDGKLDPYVDINGSKSSIAWNTSISKVVWSKLHRSIPATMNESELHIKLFDANYARSDALIAECRVNIAHLLEECRDSNPSVTSTIRSHLTPVRGKAGDKALDVEIELRIARGEVVPMQEDHMVLESHKKSPPFYRKAPPDKSLSGISTAASTEPLRSSAKHGSTASTPSQPPSVASQSSSLMNSPVSSRLDLHVENVQRSIGSKTALILENDPIVKVKDEIGAETLSPHSSQTSIELINDNSQSQSSLKSVTAFGVGVSTIALAPEKVEEKKQQKIAETILAPIQAIAIPETFKKRKKNAFPKVKVKAPMDYIVKKQIVYTAFYIDKAFVDAVKAQLIEPGVFLNAEEIVIAYEALGYEKVRVPGLPLVFRNVADNVIGMDTARRSLEEMGYVNIPFSDKRTSAYITDLLNYLARLVDFGLDEDIAQCIAAGGSLITLNDGGIVMRNLVSLVLGVWNRVRTFILMVCNVNPDNGGGRPSEWSTSWVARLAKKLEFPIDKFGVVSGYKLLHTYWKSFCDEFGIGPSLLRIRFRVYQHVLRLLDSWWQGSAPLRPDDKLRPLLEVSGNVSGYENLEKISVSKPVQKSSARKKYIVERPQRISRPVPARTYTAPWPDTSGGANASYESASKHSELSSKESKKFAPGDPVAIAPKYILYPVLCDVVDQHAFGLDADCLELFALIIGELKGTISGTPYGMKILPGMSWVALRPRPDESPEKMAQIVNQLDSRCAPGILNSGRHVLVPTTCLIRVETEVVAGFSQIQEKEMESSHNDLRFGLNEDMWVAHKSTDLKSDRSKNSDGDGSDDYKNTGVHGGDESLQLSDLGDYPGRETYIGGARGSRGAVVTAPLPDSLPDRRPKTVGPIRSKKRREQNNESAVKEKTSEKPSGGEARSLFRPVPLFDSDATPDSLRQQLADGSSEAIEILKLISKDVEKKNRSQKLKEEVKLSLHRFDELNRDVHESINHSASNKNPSRPKSAGAPRRHTTAPASKSSMHSKIKNDIDKGAAIDKILKLLDDVQDVNELQAIYDQAAGAKRRLSAGRYGLRDVAINEAAFLSINMAPKKQRAFFKESDEEDSVRHGKAQRPRSASPAPRDDRADGRSRSAKRKVDFPWMQDAAGENAPDEIEQRESERLWRSLRLTERETERREAQLKRELKKLGVVLDESDLKFD